jgi:SCY1-like protein 2
MATLNVHEAMGMKVDREAVAGLVLPQLWMMSVGPRKRKRSRGLYVYTYLLSSSQRRSVQQVHEVSRRFQ